MHRSPLSARLEGFTVTTCFFHLFSNLHSVYISLQLVLLCTSIELLDSSFSCEPWRSTAWCVGSWRRKQYWGHPARHLWMSMFVPSTYYACDCVWVWALSNSNRIQTLYVFRRYTDKLRRKSWFLKVRSCRNPVKAHNTWNCKSVADSICGFAWMVMWLRHDKCWRTT